MGCEFCHTVVLNADDLSTTALEQGGDGVPGRTMVLTNLPWTNISDSFIDFVFDCLTNFTVMF